ncbi:MAG: phospho-N-acetylmuramoyl-pentapeptide-transferase [Planctomycetes bacterium]|nr:phospho-N-acetylmuramoyl-pentapeptide-transferase [Planctomycetota bacterium]
MSISAAVALLSEWSSFGAPWPLRAAVAGIVSATLVLLFGGRAIQWLRRFGGETIRRDSPLLHALHQSKAGTPTMGGLIFLVASACALFFAADWEDVQVQTGGILIAGMAAVGFADDYLKRRLTRRGLSSAAKLLGQVAVTAGALAWQAAFADSTSALVGWQLAWAGFVVIASSNAVNLADGLDGLAAGTWTLAAVAMIGAVALAGSGANEMLVFTAALVGAVAGFLKFNRHPAQVFMGDTGALALGGVLGWLAVSAHVEWIWLVVAGVFVIEAISVLLQVGWFRATGRRVLRCAPLHHHFQFLGWPERRIVFRFWVVAGCCALIGLLLANTMPRSNDFEIAKTKVATELR